MRASAMYKTTCNVCKEDECVLNGLSLGRAHKVRYQKGCMYILKISMAQERG